MTMGPNKSINEKRAAEAAAFPRLIDRAILRTEAIVLFVAGIFILFTYKAPNTISRGAVAVIQGDVGVTIFAVICSLTGGWLWWRLRERNRHRSLEWPVFWCFLIRTYVLLASLFLIKNIGDAPYLTHMPEMAVLATYYIVIKLNAQYR